MCKKLIYLTSFILVLGLVLTSVVKGADPNLVGYWRLDEGTGTIATDSSGNGNDGTLVGGPQWVAGQLKGALQLDGIDDYVDCGNDPSLDITDAITIALWVNRLSGGTAGNQCLVTKRGAWFDPGYSFWHNYDGNMLAALRDQDGSVAYNFFFTAPPVDEWHHIAFTWEDTTDVMKGYIDGVQSATTLSFPGPIGTAVESLRIGAYDGSQPRNIKCIFDDVRIYNRALTPEEIQQAMIGKEKGLAYDPSPADEATDVPREVVLGWEPGEFAAPTNGHKVYFGESFDDVNNAVGGVAQTTASYAPAQRLDFGNTYYWRVDEVNAPPTSHVEFKGEVWSFTAEPIAYPIASERITATASGTNSAEEGPENTINGSGLDADGLHSIEATDMWLSGSEPNGAWVEFELDKVCKLHQMWVWNHNTFYEPVIGYGVKEATIEYSADGANWTTLGTTHEFAQASGASDYAYNTTVDFSGAAAKYVRLTANSNWGGFLDQYGLSEVRFFSIPLFAREPSPDSGATDVDVDVTLGFRAGREAAEHNVYLSTDEQAVIDGNAPVTTVTETSFGPLSLDLDSTYYWQVGEVNEAETTTMWQGDLWNFTTLEYLVVDDFESYNDIPDGEEGSNLVYLTWIDGYENPSANGATIGYVEAFQPSMETAIVYGGQQSVPLMYDNSVAAYSEATVNVAALQVGQDWTKHSIKALTLRFFGDPNNAVQQMYVKLNGSKVTYDGDAENIRRKAWQMWYIDLASLGVSNVTELSIGFERSGAVGGQGVVYFDGIRLYSHDRQLITPVDPGTTGLEAHYEFEGTTNDSAGAKHGTAMGEPTFVAGKVGQAINFDGVDDYVFIDGSFQPAVYTMAVWFRSDGWPADRDILSAYAPGVQFGILLELRSNGVLRYLHRYPLGVAGGSNIYTTTTFDDGAWHHAAIVKSETEIVLYVDGENAGSMPDSSVFDPADAFGLAIGVLDNEREPALRLFVGAMDDIRIYNRPLSQGETTWLAGRTKPFDKPF